MSIRTRLAVLAGLALVSQGDLALQTADRLRGYGFTLQGGKGTAVRMDGKDDDTGRPVVVSIDVNNELMTVITFEKGFYERSVKP